MSPPSETRWLHGPISDLGLGAGLVYAPVFGLMAFGAFPQLPQSFLPLLVLALSTPHLGATLLRVYERDEDRRAYRFFTVYVTLAIAAMFLVGLYVPIVGSIMITLYFTVVPWHFTGQNFGIALIFLRRRGVEVTPELRRFVYLACLLPFALWILAIHGVQQGPVDYAPLNTKGTIYRFISLQIPSVIQGPLMAVAFGSYVYALLECAVRLAGRGSVRAAFPALVLLIIQGVWFAAPVLGRIALDDTAMGPLSSPRAAYTFLWISITHGLQYLWITTYYVRREGREVSTVRYLGKALLAGSAIYGIPLLILAPAVLGRLSYGGGLYLMIAGALNLHHVMLDSAIWKLRNTRIASILIRGDSRAANAATMPAGSWIRYSVYVSGVLAVAINIAAPLEGRFNLRPARDAGDPEAFAASVQRMTWMGRDHADRRTRLGVLLASTGETDRAREQFERSVALQPNVEAWINIGALQEREGESAPAFDAYQRATTIDPLNATALFYAGRASIKVGETRRGRELLERAAALAPDRTDIQNALERASAG